MDGLHDVGDQLWGVDPPGVEILEDLRLSPPRWHFRGHFSESCQQSYDLRAHNQRGFRISQRGQGLPELVSDDGGSLGHAEVPENDHRNSLVLATLRFPRHPCRYRCLTVCFWSSLLCTLDLKLCLQCTNLSLV